MTPTSRAKRNRKKRVASKITMEMIRHALLRHVVVHGPTTWLECSKATGVSGSHTREAGYWLAGAGLITWPDNIHGRVTATDTGKIEAQKE